MIPLIFLALMLPLLALCLAVVHKRPTLGRAAVVHACLLLCGGVLTGMLGIEHVQQYLSGCLGHALLVEARPHLLPRIV